MTKSRKLSNTEMTVLGMTYLRGPCTIYAIYKELSSSESTYHKSRAGTAYSVSKRLLGFGLTEETGGDCVRITAAGEEALRDWIGPPVPMMDVAYSVDLLRTRFFFLGASHPEDRLKFIDASIEALEIFEKRTVDLISQNEEIGDYYGCLATVSLVLETRARLSWLRFARGFVEHPVESQEMWTQEILDALNAQPRTWGHRVPACEDVGTRMK